MLDLCVSLIVVLDVSAIISSNYRFAVKKLRSDNLGTAAALLSVLNSPAHQCTPIDDSSLVLLSSADLVATF